MARLSRRAAAFGIGHVHCNDIEHAPCVLRQASELACSVRVAARGKYDGALLLGLGIGQRLAEAGDREIRRRRAIDDRRNDTGPQEGERSEQTDVPFALSLPFDNSAKEAMRPSLISSFDPSPGPWRWR